MSEKINLQTFAAQTAEEARKKFEKRRMELDKQKEQTEKANKRIKPRKSVKEPKPAKAETGPAVVTAAEVPEGVKAEPVIDVVGAAGTGAPKAPEPEPTSAVIPEQTNKPVEPAQEQKTEGQTSEVDQTAEEEILDKREIRRKAKSIASPEGAEKSVQGESVEIDKILQQEAEEAQLGAVRPHFENIILPEKAAKEKAPEDILKEMEQVRIDYAQAEAVQYKAEKGRKSLGGIREKIFGFFRSDESKEKRKDAINEEYEKSQKSFNPLKEKYDKKLNEYTKALYKKKESELANDPESKKKLREYAKGELFNEILFNEQTRLNQAKIGKKPEKEQSFCAKTFNAWKNLPTYQKWLLSAGVATGFAFTGAFAGAGIGSWVAGYFGYRVGRAALGTLAARLAGGGYQRWIIDRGREKAVADIRSGATEGIEKAGGENFDDILKVLNQQIIQGRQKIAEQAKKERWQKVGQAAVIAGTAGLSTWGAGKIFDDNVYGTLHSTLPKIFGPGPGETGGIKPSMIGPDLSQPPGVPETGYAPPEMSQPGAPAEVQAVPQTSEDLARWAAQEKALESGTEMYKKLEDLGMLKVGVRGPEGAIMDHLKSHPDLAKAWGWDQGKMSLDNFAGTKAHTMWTELAKTEISKSGVIAQLEKLGYSKDLDGYAEMMRRIGKGYVDVDPKAGILKGFTDDTAFLKAHAPDIETNGVGTGAQRILEDSSTKTEITSGDQAFWAAQEKAMEPGTSMGVEEGEPELKELSPEQAEQVFAQQPETKMPFSEENAVKMGYSYDDYARMQNLAIEQGKINFGSGIELKNWMAANGFDTKIYQSYMDKGIAKYFGMNLETYQRIKEMNFNKFLNADSDTLGDAADWKPLKKFTDAYLTANRFFDPEASDIQGNVGDFLERQLHPGVDLNFEKPTVAGGGAVENLMSAEPSASKPVFEGEAGMKTPDVGIKPTESVAEAPAGSAERAIEMPEVLQQRIDNTIASIKDGTMTPEGFGNYYANKLVTGGLSDEMMRGLRQNFDDIRGANATKRLMAEGAMRVILQRLESGK